MNTFIYTLSDSKGNVRYVGKSINQLKKRLYLHIQEAIQGKVISHKSNWINYLLKNNERPIIELVDIVPTSEWIFWEQYWIEQFRQWGFNLTNLTIGGEGGQGYKHSQYSKDKMRKSKLGGSLSYEHKLNISISIKEKSKDNPNYNKCHDKIHIIDKDLLYQKYIIENLSLPKLEKFFNISETTLYRNIKEYGIEKDNNTWKSQCGKDMKPVLQYDLQGKLIKEWQGIPEINKELGFNKGNIASCCRGVANSANGFIWRYKDNFIEINLDKLKKGREVIQYTKDNQLINNFNSIREASIQTGVRENNIQDCCVSRIKSAGGFIWKYKI